MYLTYVSNLLFVVAIGVIGNPIDTDGDSSAFNFGGENAALLLLQNSGAFNQGGGVEQPESAVEQQVAEGQEGQGEFLPGTDYEQFESGGLPQEHNPFEFMSFGSNIPETSPTNNAAMLLAQNGLSSGAFGTSGSGGVKPGTQPAVGGLKPGTAPVGLGQSGWMNQAGNLFGSMFGGNNGGGQTNVGGTGGQNGPVTGQGTGVAKPSAGGVGIGLGIGAAIQSPLGGFGIGQGSSTSTGK